MRTYKNAKLSVSAGEATCYRLLESTEMKVCDSVQVRMS